MEIDAVITWVNGNDIKWQKKINFYLESKIDFSLKKKSLRYNSIGELDIAIKSIIKYAGFVRNIFLVTDDQIPKSFKSLKELARLNNINLEIIDHKVIFKGYENNLPCFNSCSIGTMLFRIPKLAEHFIVFNDDTFLMRETNPNDFFVDNCPIIRGSWREFDENRTLRELFHRLLSWLGKSKQKNQVGFKTFQQNSAKLVKTKKYLRRFHTPVSIRKSTLENFFKDNNLLEKNTIYRFRDEKQFIISSLSEHLEIINNSYHYKNNTQLTYFRSYKSHKIVKIKLYFFEINRKKLFMTFQSLEIAKTKIIQDIFNWVSKRIS